MIIFEATLLDNEKVIEIGKRIKESRVSKKIKSIDMAELIGIGKDQYSRIETGKVVCKLEYLFVISQYLEVSMDYLCFGIEANVVSCSIERKLQQMNKKQLSKLKQIIDIVK